MPRESHGKTRLLRSTLVPHVLPWSCAPWRLTTDRSARTCRDPLLVRGIVAKVPRREHGKAIAPGCQTGAMTAAPHGQHSPDGLYWWTGEEWIRAWSPDLRYWFDGTEWVPRSPRTRPWALSLSKSERWLGSLWIALAVAATGFSMQAASHNDHPALEPTWAVWTLACLGACLVILMPVSGYVVGYAPRRIARMVRVTMIMWGSLLIAYILAMAASSDQNSDIGAGVGLVILGLPSGLVVAALVGFGGLVRWGVDGLRSRFRPIPTAH